jgi:two-component system cell cycle sensor histidine kinase/response regulator CckA
VSHIDDPRRQPKHARATLRIREAKLRAVVEASAEGICLVRADGAIEYASRRALEILGVAADQAPAPGGFDWVHPEDSAQVSEALSRLLGRTGNSVDFECRVQTADRSLRWVEVHVTNLLEDPLVEATVVHLRDICARKLAEAALHASGHDYRRIIETASDGVWMLDADARTKFASTSLATMLGCVAGDMSGRSLLSFVTDEHHALIESARAAWSNGIAGRHELRLWRDDGTFIWVLLQSNPLFDARGGYEGALAMVTDVTELRRADAERARLASIVESSGDAIYSIDLDCHVLAWNRAAERLYGYSAEEMLGRSMMVLVPADQLTQLAAIRDDVMNVRDVSQLETVRVRKDGGRVEVAVSVSPIYGTDRSVIGCSVIGRDLSERRQVEMALRRSEAELRQAQKIEAVGRLAGGVAHDFNNMLSVILSYAELALERLATDDPVRDDVEEIGKAGKRAVALTRQLLAFSRQQVLQPRVLDLNDSVRGMEKMLRRLLGEHIELSMRCHPSPYAIAADPGQLEQILMNLVLNARDAMSAGGQLVLSTANVIVDGSSSSQRGPSIPGDYALLSVADTGEGMDEATQARIFDPFFTTKETGKGTGLGLSTVFGIVQQSGGTIIVDTEPNRGTRFDVYFPRADGDPDAERIESVPAPSLFPATETILLAEDEEQVRVLARTILRKHGYNVLEASDASAALRLSEQFAGAIDLLLTDVVMPHMSGRQLAQQLASGRPQLRVLYMSGYTDDTVLHSGVRQAEVAFLQKPFTPTLLAEKVRAVLDGRALRGAL